MSNLIKKKYFFTKYPKSTIFIFVISITFILDFVLTNIYNNLKNEQRREIRISHPIFHHTFKKSSKSPGIVYGNKFNLFTNSLGFKDRSSRKVELKSANHRILFMGDSFTEGIGLAYDDTFVGIIDTMLAQKNIEVLGGTENMLECRAAVKTIIELFKKFYNDSYGKLIPVRAEVVVGDEELGLGGMIDQLFWNEKSGKLEIWDWKTNTQIKQN